MKRSRFSKQQIIEIFEGHQAGMSAVVLFQKHSFTDATFYRWRSRYGRYGCVPDALVDGRRLRIACVIDDFRREYLAVVVDNSLSGENELPQSWIR